MFFSLILYLTCCCVNPRDIIQYINLCFKSTLLDEKKKKLHFLIASKIVWEFSDTKFLNICPSTEYFFSQIFEYSSFISLMLPLFIEWVFLVWLTHKHRETILGKCADCSFSNGILHLIRWRVKWFYILFLSTFFFEVFSFNASYFINVVMMHGQDKCNKAGLLFKVKVVSQAANTKSNKNF